METEVVYLDDFEKFKTISEFKACVSRGGEVEFEWKGNAYTVTHVNGKINICQCYYEKDGKCYTVLGDREYDPESSWVWVDTVDALLNCDVAGDRLRDVITQVKVWERTL